MPTTPPSSPDANKLRRCAEERLKEQHPETGTGRTESDTQRLVHELQVHQIELEMQNEQLQILRDEQESVLEKYSDLYDFAPVGYLTLDRQGTIGEANLASASLLGIERSRLVKRRLGLFIAASNLKAFNVFLAKVFESKGKEFCEVTLVTDGKPRVEVRIEALVAASGKECRAVLEDITEHKRAEADRLILNKLESTGILAGGIAHDFNNLLTVILLNLELIQMLKPRGEDLAERVEATKQTVLTARNLTGQFVTFSQGGAPVRKLASLSGTIRESTLAALSGSGVRCDFSLAADLWAAEIDTLQIGQAIRNVAFNAREAMPQGGVVCVRAENIVLGSHDKTTLPPGDYIRVSIADKGSGIAKDLMPKIFDPYFSTKQRGEQKGMGLGLTICHSIIQKHGGSITVESEVGMGTTFHICIPASRRKLDDQNTSMPNILPHHRRILVMDDEEWIRKTVGALLQRAGHEVELAEDGKSAIEAYGRAKSLAHPFDAVLLDLTIRGGMGGQEAIRELLKIDPNVKAIVMSGYADDPAILEPENHGFKGVLAKPFDFPSLIKILARVMGM
jgi:PAS domain S-box-containing protein